MRNEGRRIYRPLNEGISRPRHFVDSEADPNRYYHAYWRTRGESNLIPAYRPGPLHLINFSILFYRCECKILIDIHQITIQVFDI